MSELKARNASELKSFFSSELKVFGLGIVASTEDVADSAGTLSMTATAKLFKWNVPLGQWDVEQTANPTVVIPGEALKWFLLHALGTVPYVSHSLVCVAVEGAWTPVVGDTLATRPWVSLGSLGVPTIGAAAGSGPYTLGVDFQASHPPSPMGSTKTCTGYALYTLNSLTYYAAMPIPNWTLLIGESYRFWLDLNVSLAL